MWNFGNWRIHTYAYCFRIHLFYGSLVFKAKSCFLFVVRPETQRAYKMRASLVRIPFCILYVLQQKDSFPTAHLPEAEQLRYDTDRQIKTKCYPGRWYYYYESIGFVKFQIALTCEVSFFCCVPCPLTVNYSQTITHLVNMGAMQGDK